MKRPFVALLALLVAPLTLLVSTSLRAQPTAGSNPVVGLLRISSLEELTNAAAAFANTVQPGSAEMAAQVAPMVGQMGIDMNAELLAVLINPQLSSQPYAFVIPVVDPAAVAQNPALGMQPAGSPDVYQVMVPGMGESFYGIFVGKQLVLAPMEANLTALKPLVQAGNLSEPLRPGGGQVALTLAVDALYTAYKPMIDMLLMGAKSSITAGEQTPGAPDPQMLLGTIDNAVNTVSEIKGIGLRLNITPQYLNLSGVLTAKPESNLATSLNLGQANAKPSLQNFSSDSGIIGTFNVRPTPELAKGYLDLLKGGFAMSGQDNNTAAFEEIEQFMNEFVSVWDGTAAFAAMVPGQKLLGTGSYGITDQAKATELLKRMVGMEKSFNSLSGDSGVTSKTELGNVEQYAGANLVDVKTTTVSTSPEGEEALQALASTGLADISGTYAVTSREVFTAMGEGAREAAKAHVDGKTANSGQVVSPSDYGFADFNNIFIALSVPRMMKWMEQAGLGETGMPPAPAASEGKPGIALALTAAGTGQFQLYLGANELATLAAMGEASEDDASLELEE